MSEVYPFRFGNKVDEFRRPILHKILNRTTNNMHLAATRKRIASAVKSVLEEERLIGHKMDRDLAATTTLHALALDLKKGLLADVKDSDYEKWYVIFGLRPPRALVLAMIAQAIEIVLVRDAPHLFDGPPPDHGKIIQLRPEPGE